MNEPVETAGRREWIGLAVLALPCLLYSMDLTVLNLAVPQLTAALQPSSTELLWIVDIYGFVLAGALVPMGTLGDRIGRRRLLLIGAAAFGCASALAAFADSVATLILARAVLGLAAATLAPSTLSLIRNMFLDPVQRTLAIGIWVSSFSIGGAIGPVLGGVVLEYFWWGAVFLLNIPVMLLLLAVGPVLLPEFRDDKAGRPDIASALLCLVTVLAVIYGVKRFAGNEGDWISLASIALGLAVGVVFVRRQKRLPEPYIDLELFRRPAFSVAVGINILGAFMAFGIFLLIAQYLQLVVGLSPLRAGLWTAPSGLCFVFGSIFTPRLVTRFRPASIKASGLLISAAGFALLALADDATDLAGVVTAFCLFSIGMASVFTLTMDAIVGAAPPERAGAASGIAETASEFGGALGVALLGSVTTLIYQGTLRASLPGELAARAGDTLGGALATATRLAPADGELLTGLSRQAFMEAFQASSAICALLSLLAAVATARLLRDIVPPAAPVADEPG